MKTEISKVFISDDGKTFTNLEDCQKHEKEFYRQADLINKLKALRVVHGFDATEGKGYFGNRVYLIFNDFQNDLPNMLQFLYRKYGIPIHSWYGDSTYTDWYMVTDHFLTLEEVVNFSNEHSGTVCYYFGEKLDHPLLQNPVKVPL